MGGEGNDRLCLGLFLGEDRFVEERSGSTASFDPDFAGETTALARLSKKLRRSSFEGALISTFGLCSGDEGVAGGSNTFIATETRRGTNPT